MAVNPSDNRYKQYIGQKFVVDVGAKAPLTITIIADDGVDINYGTGAVGVTPAHSPVDFEMYQKNKEIGIIPVDGMKWAKIKGRPPNKVNQVLEPGDVVYVSPAKTAGQYRLQQVPEVRPEVVERARALAADPSYPSDAIIRQVSATIVNSPDLTQDNS